MSGVRWRLEPACQITKYSREINPGRTMATSGSLKNAKQFLVWFFCLVGKPVLSGPMLLSALGAQSDTPLLMAAYTRGRKERVKNQEGREPEEFPHSSFLESFMLTTSRSKNDIVSCGAWWRFMF